MGSFSIFDFEYDFSISTSAVRFSTSANHFRDFVSLHGSLSEHLDHLSEIHHISVNCAHLRFAFRAYRAFSAQEDMDMNGHVQMHSAGYVFVTSFAFTFCIHFPLLSLFSLFHILIDEGTRP